MKSYYAKSFGMVFVIEGSTRRSLEIRRDLRRHSEGFAWGTNWPACDQLALAILCDVYDDEKAMRHHQRFKAVAIATTNRDTPFRMTLDEVMAAVEKIEKESGI